MFGPSKRQLFRLLEREREAAAAERARLIDQICNLTGKPWTLPPRPLEVVEPDPEQGRYVVSPEQLPDL